MALEKIISLIINICVVAETFLVSQYILWLYATRTKLKNGAARGMSVFLETKIAYHVIIIINLLLLLLGNHLDFTKEILIVIFSLLLIGDVALIFGNSFLYKALRKVVNNVNSE